MPFHHHHHGKDNRFLVQTSESTAEPVTLGEAKVFLRMESTDSTAEDGLIEDFISVARRRAETITGRTLVTSSYSLFLDRFESINHVIELPLPPLSTVSADVVITYVKDTTAGDTTTIGSTVFTVDPDSEPGRIYPTFDNEWPADIRDQRKAVTIQFAAGYTAANPVPTGILNWIKMDVAGMYENRDPLVQGTGRQSITVLPRSNVDGLLDRYTIISVAT
jgi:uncharacterized phiE125 gp8 family phage protein